MVRSSSVGPILSTLLLAFGFVNVSGHTLQTHDSPQSIQPVPSNEDDLLYLARRGDKDSQERLRKIFPQVSDPKARHQAIAILATSQGRRASTTLVALYRSVDDRAVKEQIVAQLFSIGDSKSLRSLASTERDPKLHELLTSRLSIMAD